MRDESRERMGEWRRSKESEDETCIFRRSLVLLQHLLYSLRCVKAGEELLVVRVCILCIFVDVNSDVCAWLWGTTGCRSI
jgi:hypothetical protein